MDELADDARVIAGATAGPWEVSEMIDVMYVRTEGTILRQHICYEAGLATRADLAFIARARTRYPELVAEVRELRSEVAMLRRHLERQGWKPLKEGDWQTLTKTTGGVGPLQEAP